MRIGIDCRALSREKTGIGYYLWEILSHWGKSEILDELMLYSARDFEIPQQLASSHVCYRKRIVRMKPAELWMHTILPFQLVRDHIDVFWGPNYAMPLFSFGTPSVLTVHDMVYRIFPESLKRVTYLHNRYGMEWFVKRCKRVITDSEHTKKDLCHFLSLPDDKIDVIPLGVSDRFANSQGAISDDVMLENIGIEDGFYFLTVGTLEPRKNLAKVIQAYKLFLHGYDRRSRSVPSLVVVGSSGWGNISFEIQSELNESIMYLGYISDELLGVLYRHARGLVYMSLYEGFGLPPLEAMSCGTPVLVSNTSSLPEVVGECGLYADPYDASDIARQMLRLWDEETHEMLSHVGKLRSQQMGWDITAEETLRVLHRVGLNQV